MSLSKTAGRAVEAYGGRALWQGARTVEAEVSVSGLAFTLKRRPFFRHARIREEVRRPFSWLRPIGRDPAVAGVLDGPDVRLENERGEVVERREDARSFFTPGRRLLFWDDLDMAYFANYAFWNYFTLPALLLRGDIAWREPAPGLLEARFPESAPTHCREQRFRFDRETGLLIQHDYTADIISRFARAAHVAVEHAVNERGTAYASRRRVTPRGPRGNPLRGPVLIDNQEHDFSVT